MKTGFRTGLTVSMVLLGLLLLPVRGTADQVELNNGDHLSGTIKTVREGVLVLETGYSGPISIQLEAIDRMTTDAPVEIHLTEGEVLKGRLTTAADGRPAVERTAGGPAAAFDRARLKSVNPPADTKWNGAVTVGGTMKDGNTDSLNTAIGGRFTRKSGRDRLNLRLLYNYGEEDGIRTDENTYGAFKYDFFVTNRLYTLLSLELLNDTFKDLDLRTVIGPGVGYQVWDEESKSLAVEAGVSFINEDHVAGEDDNWMTGRLGGELDYLLYRTISFHDRLLVYPNLEEGSEYQIRNEADLKTSLGADWSLNLSNILEYDSAPAPGVEETDFTWILGVQYDF